MWAFLVIWLAIMMPIYSMAWYIGNSFPTRCNTILCMHTKSQFDISEQYTPITSSGSVPNNNNIQSKSTKHTLHLISLPSKNDTFALPGESLIRECWKWKDIALGDGRDYFVPRPRALKAFQSLFVGMEITVIYSSDGDERDAIISEIVLQLPSISTDDAIQSKEKVVVNLPLDCNDGFIGKEIQQLSSNENTCSQTFVIDECVTLSNCARLDAILVLKTLKENNNDQMNQDVVSTAARHVVAYNLQQQIDAQRSKSISILERSGLSSWLDLTDGVKTDQVLSNSMTNNQLKEVYQLTQRLTLLEGVSAISNHLCLIASGLAPRPNRPDREVIFRPYSSRDAHILLQLKRTVEVISVLNQKDAKSKQSGGQGRIKTLLDCALRAGKMARNDDRVPEIIKLREYGSDGTPPSALASLVAEAAIEKAVKPSVVACVAKLSAQESDTTTQISNMRQHVNDVVVSLGDKKSMHKVANRLLHEPTMLIREGQLSQNDIEDIVKSIEKQLTSQISGIDG